MGVPSPDLWTRPLTADRIPLLSALEAATAVREERLTPRAIAEALADHIAAEEPRVQAWAAFDREKALAEADAVDPAAPLAGVAFGVKDVIDTASWPTEYGSAAYAGHEPPWDAPIVALTRRFGGTLMGKTVSTEFAMSSPGKTCNPWNPAHTPGGSSSGSCAAVAAGMVHAAFGTQTSGSIIRPASYCGVVGYKPSFGTLNRTAVKVLSDSLDTIGLVTRTVADAAFLTATLAENPALHSPVSDGPLTIGVFRGSRWHQAEDATRVVIERTAAVLATRGDITVRELATPPWFEALYAHHDAMMGWETPRSLLFERTVLADRLTAGTRGFLDQLARTTRAEYDAALEALQDRAGLLDELLDGCDVAITPAAPGEAPAGLSATGDPVFNKVWTLLHGPALTLPAPGDPGRLPVGLQVVGRLGDDAGVLAAAARIEALLAPQP